MEVPYKQIPLAFLSLLYVANLHLFLFHIQIKMSLNFRKGDLLTNLENKNL